MKYGMAIAAVPFCPDFPPPPQILPLLIRAIVSLSLNFESWKYIAIPFVFLGAPVFGNKVVSDVVPPTVTPLSTKIVNLSREVPFQYSETLTSVSGYLRILYISAFT
jgi:hypothetical protein